MKTVGNTLFYLGVERAENPCKERINIYSPLLVTARDIRHAIPCESASAPLAPLLITKRQVSIYIGNLPTGVSLPLTSRQNEVFSAAFLVIIFTKIHRNILGLTTDFITGWQYQFTLFCRGSRLLYLK